MKLINLFIVLLFFGQAVGQLPEGFMLVDDINAIKKNINLASVRTNSISSDFIQEKHLTMMDEVLVSNGKFLFKKENNVLWKYTAPINYSIIVHNNRFTIDNDGKLNEYDIESNQLFKEINKMIVMAIRGNFIDSDEFIAAFYQNNKSYLAMLSPNDEQLSQFLTSIEIYFDKSTYAVNKVKFIEPGDDFTLITFDNRQENIDIPDDEFISK